MPRFLRSVTVARRWGSDRPSQFQGCQGITAEEPQLPVAFPELSTQRGPAHLDRPAQDVQPIGKPDIEIVLHRKRRSEVRQNDEWIVQRARYMTLETVAPLRDNGIVSLPAVAD